MLPDLLDSCGVKFPGWETQRRKLRFATLPSLIDALQHIRAIFLRQSRAGFAVHAVHEWVAAAPLRYPMSAFGDATTACGIAAAPGSDTPFRTQALEDDNG
jgi:hypothetical protein